MVWVRVMFVPVMGRMSMAIEMKMRSTIVVGMFGVSWVHVAVRNRCPTSNQLHDNHDHRHEFHFNRP